MNISEFGRLPSVALALALAVGADAGEMRRVEGLRFDHVDVVGSVQVEISQGDTPELQLYGSAEDLDREPFLLKGDRLVLGRDAEQGDYDYGEVKYRVVMPTLQELHLIGSGEVYVKPMKLVPTRRNRPTILSLEGSGDLKLFGLEGPAVEMRVKGSGDIKAVDVMVESLEAMVAGSGDLYIQTLQAKHGEFVVTGSGDIKVTDRGFVRSMEVNVVGSGEIDLRVVGSEVVETNIIGSGDIELGEVAGSIQGAILGSGDVRYEGDPVVDTVELGSGACRRRD